MEATIRKAFEGADTEAIDAVIEISADVLGNGNAQEIDAVQQAIVDIQEAVLALHKFQQQGAISDADYDTTIVSYGQQMDELQERLKALKESATKYAEVKYWLETYKAHIQSGESMDTDDAVMLRSLVEKIIVFDEYMEIHLRCGEVIEEHYD